MSSSPPPWLKTGLRFCGSCLVTLAFWVLWLGLCISLAALAYVAVEHELPVPGFVLRRAEAALDQAGLSVRFGRVRLDPTGKLLLEDVQVRARPFADPLLTCRLLYVERDFWSILAGQPIPDEIRLEGAALQLPAMLSPSGTTEPLAGDLTLVLRHRGDHWFIDRFNGRVGPVVVSAQGEIASPARAGGAAPMTLADATASYLRISRRVGVVLHQFDAFATPALAVQLSSHAGIGNTAELLFTAGGARQPGGQPVTLGPLVATAVVRLEGKTARPLRVHAAVRQAAFRDHYTAENLRLVVAAETVPGDLTLQPVEALVAASVVRAEGESMTGLVLRAALDRWPDLRVRAAGDVGGEALSAEVEARIAATTAVIRATGRASAVVINRVLAQHTPRAAAYFRFGDPVSFQAEATLGPGWKFATLSATTAAGRIDSHGVKIDSARGRVDIVGQSFLAHDAQVVLGDNVARGSYWMDFGTSEYRMLLDGRLRPAAINGWFHGDWWLNFWNKNFTFPGAPPAGEVDVRGFWRDPVRTVFFGHADAAAAQVWGADFEAVHATVFLRPNFTHAYHIEAERAGGAQRAAGEFKRLTDPVTRETNRLEFNFDSTVDAATIGRLLEGRADEILANLKLSQAPRVHTEGALTGVFPGATPAFSFTGRAEGGIHYFGFPLESAEVSGRVNGTDVFLDDVTFSAAGGAGTGKATVTGPSEARQLTFDVKLAQADLARTIRAVEEYDAGRPGQKPAPGTESKFMQRASGGKLDLTLAATGKPGEIATFTGAGNASIGGVELAEIHLFGVLSKVLSGLALNFSSLKLDAARSSFRLEGGRLNFPDLKVTGPSAVIDARGNFTFATKALDFTAKLKPFEEHRTLLTQVITAPISIFTSILELKLTGPVSNPDWSIVVSQAEAKPPASGADAKPPAPAIPPAAPEKPATAPPK